MRSGKAVRKGANGIINLKVSLVAIVLHHLEAGQPQSAYQTEVGTIILAPINLPPKQLDGLFFRRGRKLSVLYCHLVGLQYWSLALKIVKSHNFPDDIREQWD